jgi:hypothetical protein
MSTLLALIHTLLPHILTQAERDEAYLCEAVDVSDLERRMRDLDEHRHDGMFTGAQPVRWGHA